MKELIRRLSFSDRAASVINDDDRPSSSPPTTATTMRHLIRRLSFSERVAIDGAGAVPRGCVPVLVGDEGERFVVRVEVLRHPSLAALLEMAAHEFGYKQEGILRVPCGVAQFKQALTAAVVSTKN